jgi:hypothetical protein
MVYQRPGIYEPVLLFLFSYYARRLKEYPNNIKVLELQTDKIATK